MSINRVKGKTEESCGSFKTKAAIIGAIVGLFAFGIISRAHHFHGASYNAEMFLGFSLATVSVLCLAPAAFGVTSNAIGRVNRAARRMLRGTE